VRRVVFLSSAQVFGFAEGDGIPSYLPVDDDHPRLARRPYGVSKCRSEDLCEEWSARTGIPTIVLRPVRVIDDVKLAASSAHHFDLGAFVHVDDLADAAAHAIDAPVKGYTRLTISAGGAYDTSRARRILSWQPVHRVL
jgi:nucleoside-diphosphate-sugar epimerase